MSLLFFGLIDPLIRLLVSRNMIEYRRRRRIPPKMLDLNGRRAPDGTARQITLRPIWQMGGSHP